MSKRRTSGRRQWDEETTPAFTPVLWVAVYWLINKAYTHHTKVTLSLFLPPPLLVIVYFIWHRAGKCEVKSPVRARVHVQMRRRVTVRMIQSAIPSCEDSLRKHTRHAGDVVILRLIVCVSDVSNHRQTCGAFSPSLRHSLSPSLPPIAQIVPAVLLLPRFPPLRPVYAQEVRLESTSRIATTALTQSIRAEREISAAPPRAVIERRAFKATNLRGR